MRGKLFVYQLKIVHLNKKNDNQRFEKIIKVTKFN